MVTVSEYLRAAVKDKPLDASDVATLAEAKEELVRLRKVASRVCDILIKSSPSQGDASQPKKKKKVARKALAEDNDAVKTYKKVSVPKSDNVSALLRSAISANPLFVAASDADLDDFVDVFSQKKFAPGSTVIKQGDKGETFYVVESGSLDIYINVGSGADITETQVGLPYRPGMGFGELALIYGSPRAATIRTSDECVLWEISRVAFKGLQLQHEQKAHKLKLDSLRNVKIGEKVMGDVLTPSDLESMALAVKSQSFSKGSVIVRQGERGDVFYMITKGSVDVSRNNSHVVSLGVNSSFGEKALLSSDTRQATCVATTDVDCLTLLREDFVLLLGNMDKLLRSSVMRKAPQQKSSSVGSVSGAETTHFSKSDLIKKAVLGEGAFGKVWLVKEKNEGKLYALKTQSKAFIVENGQEDHTLSEYKIVRELNHVFIVRVYQALQDNKFVYFLMNLLPGGELMDVLDAKREFPESWTKFYGASVISAFKAIHKKKVAYRDLKPENLVLDAKGYCFLIDFGLAKKCDKGKTWTFCGTPDYLAPEIIRGKGHDWAVDYWGLGVLLYELTHGYPPFYAEDPTNTARKIIRGTFSVPSKFSDSLSDLIKRLLREQSKRLGRIAGGIEEIIKHQWFSGFDWTGLLNREVDGDIPYKPKTGNLEKLGKPGHDSPAADSNWNPTFDG